MNSKIAPVVLALAFAVGTMAAQGEVKMDRVRQAADELDHTVKRVEPSKIAPHLAKLLKADEHTVTDAMVAGNMRFSDIALAQLIADKTGQPLAAALQNRADQDWMSALAAANISWDTAYEHLDNLNMEAAFLMLDLREKK